MANRDDSVVELGARGAHNVAVILEHALLPVKPGKEVAFETAFARAKPIITGMPGFQRLVLSRCIEQPSTYLLLVQWRRLEDHIEGFHVSPAFTARAARRVLAPAWSASPTSVPYGPSGGSPLR